MVDDQVYEFDLICAQRFSTNERSKSFLGSFTVEPNQRTHKQSQTAILFFRLLYVFGADDPAFTKDALQLGEIRWRQRLVHAQLVYRNVVLVCLEELTRLSAEALKTIRRSEARQNYVTLFSYLVFKIRVDWLPLLLFDELYKRTQSPSDSLQHRHGHVLPPFVGLEFQNQREFGLDHGNARFVL